MNMDKEKTVYLIDGTAFIYRSYHAIKGLSNSQGLPTNAVFGFTKMLFKLIEDNAPRFMAVCFDAKGPTFRHELFHDYKANRPPMPDDMAVQIPYIKEIVSAFNIPVLEKTGFEADDLIGTLVDRLGKNELISVMVTGDKDFIQLVNDRAVIWDPMKDKITDKGVVEREYGVRPKQFIDVLGLAGDRSDNIPGIPGIGLKTALTLIQTYETMEKLYERIDEITKKKQRENLIRYQDQAFLSKSLASISTEAPISFDEKGLRFKGVDKNRLFGLFETLEFRQFQHQVSASSDRSEKSYQSILKTDELDGLINRLEKSPVFALDTETTSKNPILAELVGISFAMTKDEAFYVPFHHDDPGAPRQLDRDDALKRLKPILENKALGKVGQNIKYDWMVLKKYDIDLSGVFFDTMTASYLLNPSKRNHSLDQIALDLFGHKTISYQSLIESNSGKNKEAFSSIPLEKAVPYACEDADMTLQAYHVLMPKLEEDGLRDLFNTIEMPLIPVLMKMEMTGITVDRRLLGSLSKTFEAQLDRLEERIYAVGGERFNIKSSQQLGHILFEKLKLPVQKKTRKKTSYSTDMEVLTVLADQHELPMLVLRHRTLSKLKSTYADSLLDLINPATGRIHTSYNQAGTVTGRLSSSSPNLQNIPIRTEEGREIRRAFVPAPGHHLISADYSQIELRILAHYSNDDILIQSFLNDEDIHTRTAAEVFQIFPELINSEYRRLAKAVNFGIIYGMSAFGLSKELGISVKTAQNYINSYFSRYKGVKAFIDDTIERARETQKTGTLFGRIRLLPDINHRVKHIREFAERTAVNTPIQGTAADLIKLAMIKVDQAFEKKQLRSSMLLSVHDEIVFETPDDELDTALNLAKEIMEGVLEIRVPLKVNLAVGKNWADVLER